MTHLRVLAASALAGALLVGCGSNGAKPDILVPAADQPVGDVTYVVTAATQGGKPHPFVDGSEVRLAFDADSLTITAGCNTMSGLYSFDGTRLSVKGLAGTEMGCAQPLMDQDTWLTGLFGRPVQFTEGDDAAIISGDVVLSLEDRKKNHPDPPLIGTNWVADSIGTAEGDSGSVGTLEKGLTAYLRFEADGTVGIYDGCNSGSAKAVVKGDTITFSDGSSTSRGCVGGSVAELQQAFSDVLAGTTSYRIDETTLIIFHGSKSLFFRAAEKFPAHD